MIEPYVAERTEYAPDQFAALDIETNAQDHAALVAIVLAFRDRDGGIVVQRFFTWADFLLYIAKHARTNKRLRKIYAHNGSGYDWLHLLTEWRRNPSLFPDCKILRDGQGKAICVDLTLPNKRGHIKLLDSLRLVPGKLANIAHSFGVGEKVTEDVDEQHMADLLRDNPALFWKRVETDTIYLLEIIEAFGKYVWDYVFHYDELPITIGALSLLFFRSTLKKPLYTVWVKQQKEFFRRSYSGGAVNTYYRGVSRAAGLDINSEYPSVMAEFEYPCDFQAAWTRKFHDKGLYEVDYVQSNRSLPPMLRDERTGEFRYQGSGVYWSWDLSNLRRIGGSFTIKQGLLLYNWNYIFREPIQKLYGLRLDFKSKGDEAGSLVVKLLMNSMYGKFGQRPVGRETVFMPTDEALQRVSNGERLTPVAPGVYNREKDIVVDHEFVAIASAVTSRGRELLYKFKEIAGVDLLQEDTDSVKIRESALPRFAPYMDKTKLGFLKLEWRGEAAFIQNKLYAYRDDDGTEHVTSKGVPPRLLSYETIRSIAAGEMSTFTAQWDSPTTIVEVFSGKQGGEFIPRTRSIAPSKPITQIG